MEYFKKNLVTIVLCLLTSLAFAYTCSTPASSGDGGNGGDGGTTPPNPCLTDPFGETCGANFLQARVTHCITAGNASEARCNALFTGDSTSANTCPVNPFSDTCSIANGAFTTYADTARTNRVTFCNANSGNNLCSPITTCEATPFADSCGAYFEDTRTERNSFCAMRANKTDSTCTGALARPNVATLLQSFTTELRTTPTAENQFLQATATGISVAGTQADALDTATPVPTILNLETATYNEMAFGGDVEDGLAFFRGSIGGSSQYHYAGILSGTNLGAPITGTADTNLTWNGRFLVVGTIALTTDFPLTITFGADGTSGILDAFIRISSSSSVYYLLDGTFDEKGVIGGTIMSDLFTNGNRLMPTDDSLLAADGTITGLIGEEGIVAVFHGSNNNNINPSAYVGGFVGKAP